MIPSTELELRKQLHETLKENERLMSQCKRLHEAAQVAIDECGVALITQRNLIAELSELKQRRAS